MNWLSELINRLFCWVPRIVLVGPDEGGVRETYGHKFTLLVPGWYVYWPLLQECFVISVTPQVVDLRGQSLWTVNGDNIVMSGTVMYRVDHADRALLQVQNCDQSLQALALGILSDYVAEKTLEECRDREMLKQETLNRIRKVTVGWGLKIMGVYISDIGNVENIRLIGDTAVVPVRKVRDALTT